MSSLKLYTPFITEKTKNYSNWSEIFKDGGTLIYKMSNLINISKKENECEQWIFNTSQFLKSQKVKEDYGFSEPLILILSRNIKPDTLTKTRSFDTKGLEKIMNDKVSILRIIRDETSSPVSKTKIFDYKNGQYFLNGNRIDPNIHTLYYVLFDATYQITADGREILYSELKDYLKKNKVSYKIKGVRKNFQYDKTEVIKEKVANNLLGNKGILRLKKVSQYLTKKQNKGEPQIFSANRDSKSYIFNNTQFN